MSDCVTKFQNAVDGAANKISQVASTSDIPLVKIGVPAAAGVVAETFKQKADIFNAGVAVGACIDGCTTVQMAGAVGKDLNRTAGLVSLAAEVIGKVDTAVGALSSSDDATKPPVQPKPGESGGPGAGKDFSEGTKKAEREANPNCVLCGAPTTRQPGPDQSNIDHAVPKSRGGNNTPANAQNTCRTCNLQKGTKTTEEFLRGRKQE